MDTKDRKIRTLERSLKAKYETIAEHNRRRDALNSEVITLRKNNKTQGKNITSLRGELEGTKDRLKAMEIRLASRLKAMEIRLASEERRAEEQAHKVGHYRDLYLSLFRVHKDMIRVDEKRDWRDTYERRQ